MPASAALPGRARLSRSTFVCRTGAKPGAPPGGGSACPFPVRWPARRKGGGPYADLTNEAMSPLFQAVTEVIEEAVYNAMLQPVSMTGRDGHHLDAISASAVEEAVQHHGLARTGATR